MGTSLGWLAGSLTDDGGSQEMAALRPACGPATERRATHSTSRRRSRGVIHLANILHASEVGRERGVRPGLARQERGLPRGGREPSHRTDKFTVAADALRSNAGGNAVSVQSRRDGRSTLGRRHEHRMRHDGARVQVAQPLEAPMHIRRSPSLLASTPKPLQSHHRLFSSTLVRSPLLPNHVGR